eukprot:3800453-Rhodomonas_salina.1
MLQRMLQHKACACGQGGAGGARRGAAATLRSLKPTPALAPSAQRGGACSLRRTHCSVLPHSIS